MDEHKYFVLRIKNNFKLEFQSDSRLTKIGSLTNDQAYRMVNFCEVETKTEFRLVTNLPDDGDAAVSDDGIRDIYRLRWGVELFGKFLKMHLKVDKLISKSVNGITIQRYAILIAYLILQLISCLVDYPTSGRGGFTNNICQQSPISKTRPVGILWSIHRT